MNLDEMLSNAYAAEETDDVKEVKKEETNSDESADEDSTVEEEEIEVEENEEEEHIREEEVETKTIPTNNISLSEKIIQSVINVYEHLKTISDEDKTLLQKHFNPSSGYDLIGQIVQESQLANYEEESILFEELMAADDFDRILRLSQLTEAELLEIDTILSTKLEGYTVSSSIQNKIAFSKKINKEITLYKESNNVELNAVDLAIRKGIIK